MQIKSSKLLAVILILVASALALTGCGKSGSRFANVLPTIEITSYEGWTYNSVPSNVDTLSHTYSFQQRIYWHASDPDGVIAGYAFRVLDENRNPISSPGYQYISIDDDLTPPELLQSHGNGWAIHYLPGADQSLSLDDPEARRTIWTSRKYAVINFPSADENGNPIDKISYFEVVAIDNRGGITEIPAWRKFRTNSPRPTCTVSTTKGNPNGGEVGSGLKLSFTMNDTDPFISPIPFKFEFKMMKVDAAGDLIPGTETDWISTDGQEHINEYRLTRYTDPPLTYDFDDNGNSLSTTKIIARATDMAGVLSEVSQTLPLTFKVKPGFRPHTQFYSRKLLALGEYHYENWGDDTTPEVLPFTIIDGQQRYATSFFRNTENMRTLVYSPNLKAYIRWGWFGEYATVTTGGTSFDYDDPYGKKVDVVLDRTTRENYFSEITHFDIRYDDEPFNFPPFANSIKVDDDGTRWLRIPIQSPLLQSIVLTGSQMDPGHHKFEIRCVDLQDEYDPIPAVMEFEVLPLIEPAQRTGILVIDDDVDNASSSPETIVNQKYENMLSDHSNVEWIKRSFGTTQADTYGDVRSRHLALSDLMRYKTVIYHSDNPGERGNLDKEADGLALYLLHGGNLVVSHTQLLASVLTEVSKGGVRTTMLRHMGLPDQPYMLFVSNNYLTNPFFQFAQGASGYPTVDLQYGDPASFNPLVNLRHGLSAVSYFPSLGSGEPIYTFGCKPVDYPSFPPTQTQFEQYNGQIVGVKNTTPAGGKVFTFSFPLSFMQDADTKALMNKVLSEIQ
jgi:hypothetical protein